jgi:uncharacterized protein YdeI (YjbR/CyaY-like superfamily)
MKPTFFPSAAEFRDWLDKNHATATELLLGLPKKKSGPGLSYKDALDEALAFGWIDGVRKRLDDGAYTIRFTPRKPGSTWSVVNTKRVHELMELGRMHPAGLGEFENRDAKKTRLYSYEREHPKFDAALEATLRANRKAASFFDAQPPGYRRITTFWVMEAKKEETRLRRLAHLIERSAAGFRIDMLRPGKTAPTP